MWSNFVSNKAPKALKHLSSKEWKIYLLLHLYCHKSMGPDRLHPRVLRELAGVIAEPNYNHIIECA